MKQTKHPDLKAFFKSVMKSHASSRGGTISAEKQHIVQSPSLPVFRLHPQERKNASR